MNFRISELKMKERRDKESDFEKEKLRFNEFRKFARDNLNKDPLIMYVTIGYAHLFTFITKNKEFYKIAKEQFFSRALSLGLSISAYHYSNNYNFFIYDVVDAETFKLKYKSFIDLVKTQGHQDFSADYIGFKPKMDRKDLQLANRSNLSFNYKSFLEEILSEE